MVTDKKMRGLFPQTKGYLKQKAGLEECTKQNQIPPFTFLLSHLWKPGVGWRVFEKNPKDTVGFLPSYQGSNQCKEVGNELD